MADTDRLAIGHLAADVGAVVPDGNSEVVLSEVEHPGCQPPSPDLGLVQEPLVAANRAPSPRRLGRQPVRERGEAVAYGLGIRPGQVVEGWVRDGVAFEVVNRLLGRRTERTKGRRVASRAL